MDFHDPDKLNRIICINIKKVTGNNNNTAVDEGTYPLHQKLNSLGEWYKIRLSLQNKRQKTLAEKIELNILSKKIRALQREKELVRQKNITKETLEQSKNIKKNEQKFITWAAAHFLFGICERA